MEVELKYFLVAIACAIGGIIFHCGNRVSNAGRSKSISSDDVGSDNTQGRKGTEKKKKKKSKLTTSAILNEKGLESNTLRSNIVSVEEKEELLTEKPKDFQPPATITINQPYLSNSSSSPNEDRDSDDGEWQHTYSVLRLPLSKPHSATSTKSSKIPVQKKELTKKQKENMRKREREKEVKEAIKSNQQSRLQQYRRDQERDWISQGKKI